MSKRRRTSGMKGKTHSEETRKKLSELKTKYTLWDNLKVNYAKDNMFQHGRDGSEPCRCFRVRYDRRPVPIGLYMDFTTCEIIHDLIDEAIK